MTEASLLAVSTQAFIDADPYDLVLTRPQRIDNGAGGYREVDPLTIPAQRVRLIPQGVQGRLDEAALLDGTVVVLKFHVLGMPGLDIERGDWFLHDNVRMEVAWVTEPGGYEVKAGIGNRG